MKKLSTMFILILGISLTGCSSFGKKDNTELLPSPCACNELVNHAHA